MDVEVPDIWGEAAAATTNQEGIAALSQYLLTGMESCRHHFHGHAQLLHMGGEAVQPCGWGPVREPGEKPRLPGRRVLCMDGPPRYGGSGGRHCRLRFGHGGSQQTELPGIPDCPDGAHIITGCCLTLDHTAVCGHMLLPYTPPPWDPVITC